MSSTPAARPLAAHFLLLAGRAASGGLSGVSGAQGCCRVAAPTAAGTRPTRGAAPFLTTSQGWLAGRLPPPPPSALLTTPALGDQRRGFRLRDLFDKDKKAARRAAISEDIARGHFDDLSGSKTVDKPFPAQAFPPGPRRPSLPPLECVEVGAPSTAVDWRAWLTPGTLLLVGLRASAEAGLDSWAAAYAGALMIGGGGSGSSSASLGVVLPSPPPSSPRIVDLTIYDRTSALALALPGMKSALLRGAGAGAARRRASIAGAHFGRAPEVRASLRLANALAAHAVVVGREGGMAWLGSGLARASEGEVEEMVAVARAEMVGRCVSEEK